MLQHCGLDFAGAQHTASIPVWVLARDVGQEGDDAGLPGGTWEIPPCPTWQPDDLAGAHRRPLLGTSPSALL